MNDSHSNSHRPQKGFFQPMKLYVASGTSGFRCPVVSFHLLALISLLGRPSRKLVAQMGPAVPGLPLINSVSPWLIVIAIGVWLQFFLLRESFFLGHMLVPQPFTVYRERKYFHWLGLGHMSTLEQSLWLDEEYSDWLSLSHILTLS